MEVVRWILGIVAAIVYLWIVTVNWRAVVLSETTRQFHSQIPLIGSLFGVVGLMLLPVNISNYMLYLLPVLLDCGTLMAVGWGISAAYVKIKRILNSKGCSKKEER